MRIGVCCIIWVFHHIQAARLMTPVYFKPTMLETPSELLAVIKSTQVEKAVVLLSAESGSAASMPEESSSWGMQQADALVAA